jgi:alginate O-acetyltransferase complex protein AlgJ
MLKSATPMAAKLLLPALLFGYAAVANVDIRHQLARAIAQLPLNVAVVSGAVESVYKSQLPHRQLAFEFIGALRYSVLGEGRRGVVVGSDGWLFSDEEFRGAANADLGIVEASKQISDVALKLRGKGINLIIVPLPAKNDIYREDLKDNRYADISARRYADFNAALAAAGIKVIDARAALLEAKASGGAFLKTDTHWTPRGAKAVANEIAAHAALARSASFALTDEPAKDIEGDLVQFVTGGVLANFVGLPHETVTPQSAIENGAAQSGDIFGEHATFPVALVGTSYSANDTWSFAAHLEAALGLNVLNAAEAGRGPVFPMRKFLASLGQQTRPQTVIWEFPVRYLTEPGVWKPSDLEKGE